MSVAKFVALLRFARTGLAYSILLIVLYPSAYCQKPANQNSDEDAIREVVIRRQMEGWVEGSVQSEKQAKSETEKAIAKEMNFKIFFVSINSKDPTDAFINRLHDIPRVIKKVSSSEIIKPMMAVVDKATGQRGVIFRANQIIWKDKASVEVEGGYFCDGLFGLEETFKLRRTKGKRVVASTVVQRIS